MEGYWIAFGAKPLHIIDEPFCSIPTNDTNCCYLDRLIFEALAERRKHEKKGVGCKTHEKIKFKIFKKKGKKVSYLNSPRGKAEIFLYLR